MTVTHEERMQKKKAVIDGKIDAAQEERGVLVINTGNGKGKSSATPRPPRPPGKSPAATCATRKSASSSSTK